jgi:hypothetical protein
MAFIIITLLSITAVLTICLLGAFAKQDELKVENDNLTADIEFIKEQATVCYGNTPTGHINFDLSDDMFDAIKHNLSRQLGDHIGGTYCDHIIQCVEDGLNEVYQCDEQDEADAEEFGTVWEGC